MATKFTITPTPMAARVKSFFWRINYRAQRKADRAQAMASRTRKTINF